jgi:hypothetical protein
VTVLRATTDNGETSIIAYEELRRRVLAGASGYDLGQIFLLREGMVAWMAHGNTRTATAKPIVDQDRRVTAPVLSDEIHTSMVRVLASMALAGRREMTP